MRRSEYGPRAWRVGSYRVTDGLQPAGRGDSNVSTDTDSHDIEVEGGQSPHTGVPSGALVPRPGMAGVASAWTGKLSAIHFAIPPSRGRTRVIPRRLS
jgi:hypothetical protein